MFVYIVPFLVISLISLSRFQRNTQLFSSLKISVFCLLLFVYGLADGLGPDFELLKRNQALLIDLPFNDVLFSKSILYSLISYVSGSFGFNLVGVNLLCALLLLLGLFIFLQSTKDFWLGLIIAYPGYIVISLINFNRQSAAIGLSLIALTLLFKQKKALSALILVTSSLIHPSSFILAPLLFVNYPLIPHKLGKKFLILSVTLLASLYLFGSYIIIGLTGNLSNFFDTPLEWVSYGVWFRLAPILIAFFLAVVLRNKLFEIYYVRNLFLFLGFLSILLFSMIIAFPSQSTVADRLSLYLLPLPIYIFPQLPEALPIIGYTRSQYKLFIICIVFVYLCGWLYFSPYAKYWLPYSNVLF